MHIKTGQCVIDYVNSDYFSSHFCTQAFQTKKFSTGKVIIFFINILFIIMQSASSNFVQVCIIQLIKRILIYFFTHFSMKTFERNWFSVQKCLSKLRLCRWFYPYQWGQTVQTDIVLIICLRMKDFQIHGFLRLKNRK